MTTVHCNTIKVGLINLGHMLIQHIRGIVNANKTLYKSSAILFLVEKFPVKSSLIPILQCEQRIYLYTTGQKTISYQKSLEA